MAGLRCCPGWEASPPASQGPQTSFCSLQIAIYGTNFCTSARNAFFLLMRNIIRSGGTRLHPPAYLSHLTLPSPPPALAPFLNQPSTYCASPPASTLSQALNPWSHSLFTLPYRVAVLDKVTDFLFLLGKLLVVGSVGEWCPRACPSGMWEPAGSDL